MRLIEWEVAEDGYEEQINIHREQRDLAEEEGKGLSNLSYIADAIRGKRGSIRHITGF